MGKRDYYLKGSYNKICDICGQKFKAHECRMQWNNLQACRVCFEKRNPQDFVKGVKDDQRVPIARPDAKPDKFITTPITPEDL